jgi:hypothetical protein
MLPSVKFCGLNVTRLILGANPFGGFSHQGPERNREMLAYYTVARVRETWERAEAAGINTIITNNTSENVVKAVREYLGQGGALQWIAQVSFEPDESMDQAIDEVMRIGCRAMYLHGGLVDEAYERKDEAAIRRWCDRGRSAGVPVGVAGHAPQAHRWVDELGVADFHAVSFFNYGRLYRGKGDKKFLLSDVAEAVACIHKIRKPCIAYKIMAAGRIDARMAFEYAFESIKPTDVVNVGVHRGDKDNMVEENAALVREILAR